MSDDDWVEAGLAYSVQQAYLWRSVLGGHGIEAYVPDEHAFTMRPGLAFSQGVRVMVHRSALASAKPLIEELERA
ncbi:MAG: DUF2007 domain-containing protein [Acidobacteria bacterium]|nr:DUF2007 domain-containing protein [Acidobacteriota bacterium]